MAESLTRRALLGVGAIGLAGGLGYGGWRGWLRFERARLLSDGWAALEQGNLRDAKARSDTLVERWPDFLDGYLLGAWALRAQHQRPATAEILGKAYDLAPHGFPMLPEYVDHRMRGPDDPRKGYDSLAFLDQHLRNFPDDAKLVAEARLIALAYILDQGSIEGEQRQEAIRQAEDALAAFQIQGRGTTTQHYDRAQCLLALGRRDEAIEACRKGIAAGTDKWMCLVMEWSVLLMQLHNGKDEEAYKELDALTALWKDWPGTHFGQGKPLVELVQLTWAVRFGRKVEPPPDYEERLARLDTEGVRLQYGDAETRKLIQQLLAALDQKATREALRLIGDMQSIVDRDRGCELENQVVRPNTTAMLLALKGNLLLAEKQFTKAEAAYRVAASIFPNDAWLDEKIGQAQFASIPEDKFDPSDLPRDKIRDGE